MQMICAVSDMHPVRGGHAIALLSLPGLAGSRPSDSAMGIAQPCECGQCLGPGAGGGGSGQLPAMEEAEPNIMEAHLPQGDSPPGY